MRAADWKLELESDVILPTAPEPAVATGSLDALRRDALASAEAQIPKSLRHPAVTATLSASGAPAGSRWAIHYARTEGGGERSAAVGRPPTAPEYHPQPLATAHGASLAWVAAPNVLPPPGTYTLLAPRGDSLSTPGPKTGTAGPVDRANPAALATLVVTPDGELRVSSAPSVHISLSVSPPSGLAWRAATAPRWTLDAAAGPSSPVRIALYDAESGWALTTTLAFHTRSAR